MIAALLAQLHPISLEELKNKAELLERRDNKYVLNTAEVITFLQHCKPHFDILTINGLRQFHYLSKYFDSPQLDTHLDHNKGRRRRIKIRQRHYVDSDRYYFEIKLKGFRKLTQKYRILFRPNELTGSDHLNNELRTFYRKTVAEHYGQHWPNWPPDITPSLSVGYQRITLVAKGNNERITLDNGIYYINERSTQPQPVHLNDDKWVIEVKSTTGRTTTDRWLFRQGHRPVPLCSKYGMGVNLLKMPHKNNRFSRTLRRYFLK